MIAIEINEIKSMMQKLFLSDVFDSFLMEKANALTSSYMELSGRRTRGWYDTEKWQQMEAEAGSEAAWMTWKECKPVLFQYIRGKQSPETMRILLKARQIQASDMLRESGILEQYRREVPDLFLSFRYEEGSLQLVTGASYSEFVLDKSVERAWDEAVLCLLRQEKVAYDLPNR